jgi:hypothetical protein
LGFCDFFARAGFFCSAGSAAAVLSSPSWAGIWFGEEGGGSGEVSSGFDTVMTLLQDLHLNLAPFSGILAGSIRYFLPHSSQITIMAKLLT